MHSQNETAGEATRDVRDALHASPLKDLTADEMLAVLCREGVVSVEDLLKRLRGNRTESQSPAPINLQMLSRETPRDDVARIEHRAPKVPFIVNGTFYDPGDIRRFNGRELHFIIGSASAPHGAMLGFDDRTVLTSWLQIVYLSRAAGMTVRTHGPEHPENPTGTYVVYPLPIQAEPSHVRPTHAFMYSRAYHSGMYLELAPGLQLEDLGKIFRADDYGFRPGLVWDNAISSIHSTSSLCLYWEHPHFQGAMRIVVPNMSIPDLDWLGFDDTISSVMNLG
jgi:hypothetical protein